MDHQRLGTRYVVNDEGVVDRGAIGVVDGGVAQGCLQVQPVADVDGVEVNDDATTADGVGPGAGFVAAIDDEGVGTDGHPRGQPGTHMATGPAVPRAVGAGAGGVADLDTGGDQVGPRRRPRRRPHLRSHRRSRRRIRWQPEKPHGAVVDDRGVAGPTSRFDRGGPGMHAFGDDGDGGPGIGAAPGERLADVGARGQGQGPAGQFDDVIAPGRVHQHQVAGLDQLAVTVDGGDDDVGVHPIAAPPRQEEGEGEGEAADDDRQDVADVGDARRGHRRVLRRAQRRASARAAWRASRASRAMSATARSMPTRMARATIEWPMLSSSISRMEAMSWTLS